MHSFDNEMDHMKFLLKQGGVSKLVSHMNENVAFDMKNKTRTAEWLPKNKFTLKPANLDHGVRYRAAATSEVVRALEFVKSKIDISEATFYDFGCGKGKVLCIAGLHGFKAIHGVDYYPPFLMQAQQNLEACKLEGIHLHAADMTEFTDFDETSVIFFYNPANAKIIEGARENIEKNTKKAIVIYNKPEHPEIFDGWTRMYHKENRDPDHRTTIFGFGF
ncbi:MAG: methyltransferase domain-containing protein [Alphaproteobacteria bacterium]|nr:methyltransferase domain-containing protein [Alphaproteobacteria bacterium]